MKQLIFTIVILLHLSVYAQQSVYYYYGDEKIYLTESSDKVFVKFNATGSSKSSLMSLGITLNKIMQ